MVICIVIPAFNAAPSLAEVMRRIRQVWNDVPVIVVDDGSHDGTAVVAAESGATVIRHEVNQGKGAALRSGIRAACTAGADAIIQMDADGQHEPESLSNFVRAFERGDGDIIIGARSFHGGGMPWPRRLSNTMTSWILSRMCGLRIPDSQSGYRLIGRRVAELVNPKSNAFDFESEYLILAARSGFRIGSVPIATVYGNETSCIHGWRDTFRFIKLMGLFWNNRSDNHLQDARTPA